MEMRLRKAIYFIVLIVIALAVLVLHPVFYVPVRTTVSVPKASSAWEANFWSKQDEMEKTPSIEKRLGADQSTPVKSLKIAPDGTVKN
jgi:hypothetical protein